MFDKILIANRGEIACRVAATARRLGVKTVAVYSDADAHAKHVAVCDEAVHIGPAALKDSYLSIERILAAAKSASVQAIHPGYGFLSENEHFARACQESGMSFIGPPARAIAAMGTKRAAKALVQKIGIPIVPGYHGDEQHPDRLLEEAQAVGFPILLKASAGGGGKGMRVVEKLEDFTQALDACKREALKAFGNDVVLLEKYLRQPRHIEVQVFADAHGNFVYLFERDCSVQRRHQKIVEEAPAFGIDEKRRKEMGEAATSVAKAVGYVGAGTVEFIAVGDAFYFMEMNTRLQVEHPVTELVTGYDLVAWQLSTAAGAPLPVRQEHIHMHGHALEVRLYAEAPEKGFLPSTGKLVHLRFPAVHGAFTGGDSVRVRVDSGVRQDDAVVPFYDPMLAKLIVWGADRQQAIRHMTRALEETQVVGVATNLDFLRRILALQVFRSAPAHTGTIDENRDMLFPAENAPDDAVLALSTAAVLLQAAPPSGDPWAEHSGWRLNQTHERTLRFSSSQGVHDVRLEYRREGFYFVTASLAARLRFQASNEDLQVRLNERHISGTVVFADDKIHVFYAAQHTVLQRFDPAVLIDDEDEGCRLTAPMPGKIVDLLAQRNVQLKKGAPLLVMEAMKMEHTITAPSNGFVASFHYEVGDQVLEGAKLLTFIAP